MEVFFWRKRATARWLDENEAALRESAGSKLAVIEHPLRPTILLEVVCRSRKEAQGLVRHFGGATEKLPADWLAFYARAHGIPPLRIGKRLIITPEETSRPRGASRTTPRLLIPAGAAFGTGDHATTAMSLRLLERITRRRETAWAFADLGTGSGILALAARIFGAARIVGVDNDPRAIVTARANARRNGIARAKFQIADVCRWRPAGKVDVIGANLYSELLIETLPLLRRYLAPEGWLIASGIMRSQERGVRRALRASGMEATEVRRRGKWIAVLARPRH